MAPLCRVKKFPLPSYAPCTSYSNCETFAPMNLRKTIAGAAIALGSATVMLGLGGTANAAAGADAGTSPNLDLELGKVGTVGELAQVDTNSPVGVVDALNFDAIKAAADAQNLDAGVADNLLGYDMTPGQVSHVGAGAGV